MHYYQRENNAEETQILQAFDTHTQLNRGTLTPYITACGIKIMKEFVDGFHHGITVTCPGFYGPQGRVLRMGLVYPNLIDALTTFRFGQHRITNFEMETSALYGMSRVLGHHCVSLSAIVANRIQKEFTKDGNSVVEKLIQKTLGILAAAK
jgi:uridine phosphorylase